MMPIATPVEPQPREEWADSDFDIPEGRNIILPPLDDEDDKDNSWSLSISQKQDTLRVSEPGEGDVSTIKVSALPLRRAPAAEDNLEDDFAIPDEVSKLSLRPALHHHLSNQDLDWHDREHTTSSSSTASISETFSSLGLHNPLPTSPSTASIQSSLPMDSITSMDSSELDTCDDDDLDGLILPSTLFESKHAAKALTRILEAKKSNPIIAGVSTKTITPMSDEQEANFEAGLVINDDVDLSPSRLLIVHTQKASRLPVKLPTDKKFPISPSPVPFPARPSSQLGIADLQKSRAKSPSRSRPPSRAQASSALSSFVRPVAQSLKDDKAGSSSRLEPPRGGSLRGQISMSGFKSFVVPKKMVARKSSLSALNVENSSEPSQRSLLLHSTVASRARTAKLSSSTMRVKTPDSFGSQGSTSSIMSAPIFASPASASSSVAKQVTLPSSLSRMKVRPPISSVFPGVTTSLKSSPPLRPKQQASPGAVQPVSILTSTRIMRRPKRPRIYGDGTELDSIDDLPTDRDKESRFRVTPKPTRIPGASYPSPDKAAPLKQTSKINAPGTMTGKVTRLGPVPNSKKKTSTSSSQDAKKASAPANVQLPRQRKPTLIRNLGGTSAAKVVGEMRWNPQTLRWEGNEHILRDFETATASSTRPALITHLTGSSLGSPVSGFAAGARVVGNMIFDPVKMCWLSRLAPEDDEPDAFANMGDDEDEHSRSWEEKGGTIRASASAQNHARGSSEPPMNVSSASSSSSRSSDHIRQISESDSEHETSRRGSRPLLIVAEADDAFIELCHSAEQKHSVEMAGWMLSDKNSGREGYLTRRLYWIRELATKEY